MELLKAFVPKFNSGFTLVEMMVVTTIIAVISVLGLAFNMDEFRGFNFRDSRDAAVAALQQARSQAVSNVCLGASCGDGKAHGVHFETGKIVIFQGADYPGRDFLLDEIIDLDGSMDISGDQEIIFEPLSGASAGGSIVIKDGTGRISQVEVNSEGRINWSN